MKLRGLIPNFQIHVSESDLYIPTICLPILHCNKLGGPIGTVHLQCKPQVRLSIPQMEILTVRSQKRVYNKKQQKITSKYKAYRMAPYMKGRSTMRGLRSQHFYEIVYLIPILLLA
jgi:hypothetical protein